MASGSVSARAASLRRSRAGSRCGEGTVPPSMIVDGREALDDLEGFPRPRLEAHPERAPDLLERTACVAVEEHREPVACCD